MRNVPAIAATGVEILREIVNRCEKHHIAVVFSHVNEQPMAVLEKAGLVEHIGRENFCDHIDAALHRAEILQQQMACKNAEKHKDIFHKHHEERR